MCTCCARGCAGWGEQSRGSASGSRACGRVSFLPLASFWGGGPRAGHLGAGPLYALVHLNLGDGEVSKSLRGLEGLLCCG